MASSLEPLLAGIVRDYAIRSPKYAVVGRTFGEATHWAREHHLGPREYGIVTGSVSLAGLAPPWEVILTGWPDGIKPRELHARLRVLEASGVRVHWNGDIDT